MTSKTSSYREPLILIAFVALGAVLGIVLGEKAAFLYPIGQIWLNMLFVLLVPLIFFSISSSIAGITDTRRVGKMLALTIGIFVLTAAAAGIYMFLAWIPPCRLRRERRLESGQRPESVNRLSTRLPSVTSLW